MQSLLTRYLIAAFVSHFSCPSTAADSVSILVHRAALAGSQYYAVKHIGSKIRIGDPLELIRETDNRHDRNAVRVAWRGQTLGHVPRAENLALARALDAGERIEARVASLRDDPDPWRRLELDIFLVF